MITLIELTGGADFNSLPLEHQNNLTILHFRINKVRSVLNKIMIVSSGYRTEKDHLRIYAEINKKRFALKLPELKVPMGSWHLKGAAVDISDKDGSLHQWCLDNEELLAEIGLWMEEKDDQKRVHFQIYPPKSGKRFFKP